MHTTTTTSYAKHTRRHTGAARRGVATDTRPFAALRGRRWGRGARGRREGAFSLMEVLIALGIFAIGLVAVAAVFPTAISIQSETVRDLAGQRAVINARTMIQALARSTDTTEQDPPRNYRTLTYKHDVDISLRKGTLHDYTVPLNRMWNNTGRTGFPGGVQPMLDQPLPPLGIPSFAEMNPGLVQLNAPKSFEKLFSLDVRSYPQNIPQTDRRDYYWFPLIQARDLTGTNPTWMVYLMVMQRRGSEAVPEVRAARIDPSRSGGSVIALAQTGSSNVWDNDSDDDGLPDLIQPGDWVLDSRGTIHRVLLAEKNQITVESAVPVNFVNGDLIYFATAYDRADPGVEKRESRSPIVRIDQFEIVVDKP